MTTDELLRSVDRSNPEVKQLAEQLQHIQDLVTQAALTVAYLEDECEQGERHPEVARDLLQDLREIAGV